MRPWEDYAGSMAYEEPASSPSYWSDLPQEPYIYEEPVYNPPAYNPPAFVPYEYETPNALWEAPAYTRPTFEPFAFEDPNPLWEAPAVNWNNPVMYNEAASVLARPRPATQFVMPYEENPAYGGPEQYVPEPDTTFDYFPGQRVIERPPLQGPTDWTSTDPADWTLDPEERRKLKRAYGVGTDEMFDPSMGIQDFLERPVPQRMGSGGTDWNDLTYNELVTPEERQAMLSGTLKWADLLDASTPMGDTIGPRTSNLPFEEERRLSMLPRRPENLTAFGDTLAGERWGTGPTLEEEGQAEFGLWQWTHPTEARTLSIEEQLHEFQVEKNSGPMGTVNAAMTAFVYLRDDWAKPAFIQSINYMEHPIEGQQEFKKLLEGDVSWQELSARREDLKVQYEAEMEAMGMFETPVRLFLDVFLDPFTYASLGLNKAMTGAKIAGAEAFAELSAVEKIVAAGEAGIRLTPAQRAVLTASQTGKYVAPEVAEAAVANASNSPRILQLLQRNRELTLPNSVSAAAVGKPLTGWQALVDDTPTLLRELIDNGNLETIIAFNIAGEIVNQSGVLQTVDDPMMQTALSFGLSIAGAVAGVTAFKAAPPVLKSAYNIADGMAYAHIVQQYPGLLDSNSAARSAPQAWKEAAGNIVMAARISAEFALQYPGPAIDALWNAVKEGTITAERAAKVIDDALRMPGMEGMRDELTPGRAPIGINAAAQREVDLEQAALGGGQQTVFGKNMVGAPRPGTTPGPVQLDTARQPVLTRVSSADEAKLARPPQQYTAPAEASGVASVDVGGGVFRPAYIVRGADGAHHIQIGDQQFGQSFRKWQDAKTFLEEQGGTNTTSLMKDATVLVSGTGDVIIVHPYGKGATPSGFMIRVNGSELKPRFKTLGDALAGLPAAISVIDQPGFVKGDAATWRPADVPGINWKYSGGGRATAELPNGKKLTVWRPQDGKGWKMTIPGTYTGEKASTYRYMQEDEVMGAIRAAFGMAARDPSVRKQAMATDEFGMYEQGDEFGEVGTYYTENGGEVYIDPGAPVEMDLPGWGIADDVEGEAVLKPFYAPLQVEIEAVLAELQGLATGVSGTLGEVPAEYTELGFTPVPNHLGHHVYEDETPTGRIYVNPWAMAQKALDGVVTGQEAEWAAFMESSGEALTAPQIFARQVLDTLAHEIAHYVEPHPPGAELPPYHAEFRTALENIWKGLDEGEEEALEAKLADAISDDMLRQLADSHRAIDESGTFKGERPDVQYDARQRPADSIAGGNAPEVLPPGARSGGADQAQGLGDNGLNGEVGVRGERAPELGATEQAGLPAVRGIDVSERADIVAFYKDRNGNWLTTDDRPGDIDVEQWVQDIELELDRLGPTARMFREEEERATSRRRNRPGWTTERQTADGTPVHVEGWRGYGETKPGQNTGLVALGVADIDGNIQPYYGPISTTLNTVAGKINETARTAGVTGEYGQFPEQGPRVGISANMDLYGVRGPSNYRLPTDPATGKLLQPPNEINLNLYQIYSRAQMKVLQQSVDMANAAGIPQPSEYVMTPQFEDARIRAVYAGEILMVMIHESAHAVELHSQTARKLGEHRYARGDFAFNKVMTDLNNSISMEQKREALLAIMETLTPEALAGIRETKLKLKGTEEWMMAPGRDKILFDGSRPRTQRRGTRQDSVGEPTELGDASGVLQRGERAGDIGRDAGGRAPAEGSVRATEDALRGGVPGGGRDVPDVRRTDERPVEERLIELLREFVGGKPAATADELKGGERPPSDLSLRASMVDPEELRLAKQEAMETGDYSKVDALNESMAPKPGEGTPPGYIKDPRPAPTLQKLSDEELARQLANAQERRDSFWGDNADEDVAYEQADQVMQQARMEGIRRVIQNPELAIETASVDNGVVTVVFRDNPLTRTLLSEAGGKMEQEIPVAVWQRYFGEPPAEVREQFQTGMITDRELRQAYPNSFLMSQRGINGEPGLKVGGAYLAQADALKNFFIQQGKDDLPELDDYLAKYPIERASGTTPLDAVVNRIGGEGGGIKTREELESLRTALKSVLEGLNENEVGSVNAVLMSEAGLTAAAGGLGYITGDEDEDRNLRAAQFALVGAAVIPTLKGAEYITGRVKKARIPEDAKAVPQQAPAPFGTMPREWVEQFFGKDVADKAWLEWTARNAELAREARDVSEDIRRKSGSVLNTTYEHMRDWFNPMAKVPDEARRTVNAIEAQMATAFEGVANTLKGADAKGLTKRMTWQDRLDIFQAIEQPEKYMRLISPEKQQVAQTLRTVFDMIGRAAVDAGIFSPEMVEKNPAYITHMWDYLGPDFDKVFKGSGGSEPRVRKAAPELKREWGTIEEAINSSDPTNRLVLSADFDPVDIAAGYADVMYRRIAGERLKEWIELNHGGGDEAFVTEQEWAKLPASQQAKYQTFDADPLKQPRFSNTTQANLTAIRGLISKIDSGIRRAERWSGIYGDRAHQLEQLAYDGDTRLARQIEALATYDYTNAKDVLKWKGAVEVRKQELNSSLQLLGKAIEERKGARIGERDARDAFKVAENEMKKLDESQAALEQKYSEQGIALYVAGGGEWKDDLAREIIQLTNAQTRVAEQMRTLAGRIATAEVVAGKLALEAGVREDLGNLFDDAVGSLRRDVRRDVDKLTATAKAEGRREAAPLTEKVNGRIEELTQRIQQLERMTMRERGKIPGLQDKVDNLKKWRDAARDLRDDLMVREQKETSPLLVRNDYQPIFERYKPGWEGTPILSSAKDAANSLSRTVLSGAVDLYMIGATAKTALGMGLTPGVRTVSTTGMGQALYHAAIAAVRPEHRAMLQEMNAPIREKLRAAGMGLGVDSHDIMRMVNGEESPTIPGRILPGKVGKGYESLTRWMEEAQFSGWIDTLKTMLGADVAARHMKNGMVEAEAWERAAKTMDMAFGGKNMRATGHKTATTDAMRFFLLAPNWFMTRGELFVDAVNPTSWRGSYGKQWAVQTAFMGGLASLLATAVYSAMEEDGAPDWGKVMAEWKRSTTDPRHFMEVKTPDGQFVSLLNWEKDIIRFPLFAYYAAQGDMDAANEALGPYAKARQNILPRLLYDLTINKNFAGKSIYDTPEGIADFKGIAKAAGQIAKSVGIEGQPQFLSEAEKVIPNKLLNKVLPGSPLDEDKTLGESMGQGRNTPQGVIQNMTGLGRARSLTPIQMAMQDDIEAGTVDPSRRDYSRLTATEKKEFKLRHAELKDYFDENLPEQYVEITKDIDAALAENTRALRADEITVGDWKGVYGNEQIRRGTVGDYAFPDGSVPSNDQERAILNDWYSTFDAAKDERNKLNPEKLDELQQDFFTKWEQAGIDLVENYQLLGKDPAASLHIQIMRALDKDGYWDMKKNSLSPKFRQTEATVTEEELRDIKLQIDNEVAKDFAKSQRYDPEDRIWVYGKRLGYDTKTLYDVTLLGDEEAMSPELAQYKKDHPGFMDWLSGRLPLSGTIAKLQLQGFKIPEGLTAP